MQDEKKSNLYVLLLVFLAAVLGGGAGVFGKIALVEIPSFSFTFLRFLIATVFLVPFSLKHLPTFSKKDSKIILLSLLASINVILFSFGIKYTTANIGQMIYTAVPIVTAVFSFYLLKERSNVRKITGILIGFAGAMLIVLLPLLSSSMAGSTLGGNLIIFVAMLSISLYWVLSKRLQSDYTPMQINNYFIFTTAFLTCFLSIYDLFKHPYWWQGVSLKAYFALAFVAVFATAICYLISQIIIKKANPVIASMILYVQPFTTFIWAYYFLSEKLTTLFLVGAVLSLIGVGIYNFSVKQGGLKYKKGKTGKDLVEFIENGQPDLIDSVWLFGNIDGLKNGDLEKTNNFEMKYWAFTKNSNPSHKSKVLNKSTERTLIIRGKIEGNIAGEPITLETGDYVIIRPETPNNLVEKVIENTMGITIKSPSIRDDTCR